MTQSTKPAQAPASTGFELIEKLLAEYRDTSKSATHEKWQKEFRARLAEFRAANPSPKILKDAAQVEKAYELAGKLLESIRPAKPGPASKKA